MQCYRKVICKQCWNVIYSSHRHDMKWCPCGAIAIDGGGDYMKLTGNLEDILHPDACCNKCEVGSEIKCIRKEHKMNAVKKKVATKKSVAKKKVAKKKSAKKTITKEGRKNGQTKSN